MNEEFLIGMMTLRRDVERRVAERRKGKAASYYTVQVIRELVARGEAALAESLPLDITDAILEAEARGEAPKECADAILAREV